MPFVLILFLVTAGGSFLIRALGALVGTYALSNARGVPVNEALGFALLNAMAAVYAFFVLRSLWARGAWRPYLLICLYPWFLIVLYVAENYLRIIGFYPAREPIPPKQLEGAAMFELLRYLWLLGLFVWVRLSKRARAYVTRPAEIAARASA